MLIYIGYNLPPAAATTHFRQNRLPLACALTKQGIRFLKLVAVSQESSAAAGQLRKFVAISSKHVALTTLSHLLSHSTSYPHLSSLVYPLYSLIKQQTWFQWNAKQVAELIAKLVKEQMLEEADELLAEATSKLDNSSDREICGFFCNLVDSHAKHKSEGGVLDTCEKIRELIQQSSSVYIKQRGYQSMIGGLCQVGLPLKAEILIEEMRENGIKPSIFDMRSLVYGYGQAGFLEDMKRSIIRIEAEGHELDTVCYNMVITSLGSQGELLEMLYWLKKMRQSGIPPSIRTYNSVLNSCQGIIPLLENEKSLPFSIDELLSRLKPVERDLVRELLTSSVLDQLIEWKPSEMRLDLHGMHLSTAFLILLQWIDELKQRVLVRDETLPTEILVICGCGKHSYNRGESPVRGLAKEMMKSMQCPLRIDRKRDGCFTGKGKALTQWILLQEANSNQTA